MFWETFDVDAPENTHFDRVSGESLLQLKVGLLMLFHVVFLNRTLSFNDVCLAFCFPGHGVR